MSLSHLFIIYIYREREINYICFFNIKCDPSAQNQSQVAKHKMAENCILSQNVKNVLFFHPNNIFLGKTLSKYLFFTFVCKIFLLVYLAVLNVPLNDVEIWFFFFNNYFLIIMFPLFAKFHNFG